MTELLSFGGGVNSVAMSVLLVERGWRGPIVFADTGGEHPETYCYLEYFVRQFLQPRGLEVIRLPPGSAYHSRKARLPLEAYCLAAGIVPLLAVRWCSVEWKRDPLVRWAKAHGCQVQLLGISASEPQRVRDDPMVRYPLVEEGLTRGECRRLIRRAGLLVPRKSGCFFCPGSSLSSWRALYFQHPELYQRAEELEDNASARCKKWATLDPHGVSLRQHRQRRWQGQQQMDLSAWLPCVCQL